MSVVDEGPIAEPPRIRIETIAGVGSLLFVIGWIDREVREARARGQEGQGLLARDFHPRDDVAAAFGLPFGRSYGFALIVGVNGGRPASLEIETEGGVHEVVLADHPVAPPPPDLLATRPKVAAALARILEDRDPNAPDFGALSRLVPDSGEVCPAGRGYIETAIQVLPSGEILVTGWVGAVDGTTVWLETDRGATRSLETGDGLYRFHRDDARTQLETWMLGGDAPCFLARLAAGSRASRLRLRAVLDGRAYTLHAIDVACATADPHRLARRLFAIETPLGEFGARCRAVDAPIIESAMARHAETLSKAMPITREIGVMPEDPDVALVVPLYRVHAFAEHQLQAFARDPFIRHGAEIVYVVDDPLILDAALRDIGYWAELHGIGCRLVWTGHNHGYSGANNIGAAVSRAPLLVFLNSDVFPEAPGWVERLAACVAPGTGYGAVAPRLLHPDGSIQHDGMVRRWREDLGIWINDHPRLGLDPRIVGRHGLVSVPAVTGACMAVPRSVLSAVGGWSEHYLVGDFEDSDLCAAIRSAGWRIGLVDDVSLVHLERQSMSLVGEAGFRQRLTIFNAVRHEARWPDPGVFA